MMRMIQMNRLVPALCIGALVLASSCAKKDDSTSASSAMPSANPTEHNLNGKTEIIATGVKKMIDRMPEFKMNYNGKSVTVWNKDGFSFAESSNGYNFSSNDGVEYVKTSDGGRVFIVSSAAFGSNTGGGKIQAGNTTFNMSHTFCFTANDSNMSKGFDFFGMGKHVDGISMVVGIDGDFDKLTNRTEDDTTKVENILNAIAIYYVFDGNASGTYDVINWFDLMLQLGDKDEEPQFTGSAFAYIFDFKNAKIYFSSRGSLNVAGGSITFNGKYLAIDFKDLDNDDDKLPNFEEVDGLGTMGCN